MAEQPNPAQLAPGEEAGTIPQDTPYVGYRPAVHIGYPINGSFFEAASEGRA